MAADVMDIRRGDGWPQQLGSVLLYGGLLLGLSGALLDHFAGGSIADVGDRNARLGLASCSLLVAAMGFLLQSWRRVTTLDRARRVLWRWWGLQIGPWLVPINGLDRQSLADYDQLQLAATGPEEHYKRQSGRYQLHLVRSTDPLPVVSRLRVDDELVSQAAGREMGERVAAFLGVEFCDLSECALDSAPAP